MSVRDANCDSVYIRVQDTYALKHGIKLRIRRGLCGAHKRGIHNNKQNYNKSGKTYCTIDLHITIPRDRNTGRPEK